MAATWLWVVYWTFTLLTSLLPIFNPVFFIHFFAFLILMRVSNNEMSMNSWCGYYFSLARISPMLRVQLEKGQYWSLVAVSSIVRLCVSSDYMMPTATFWILILVLVVYSSPPQSLGSFIWYTVYIFNVYIDRQGVHLPGVLISHYITAAVALAVITYTTPYGYWGTVLAWFVSMAVLHNHVWPWNEDFGLLWIGAWVIHFHAMMLCFAPSMPYLWYPSWVVIVIGLGFLFHPETSLVAFTLWSITLIVLRMIIFIIYIVYFVGKGWRADLFPFNLFSDEWKASNPPWFPLSSRGTDSLNDSCLCERCAAVVDGSKLIMGSASYFSRMVEWHDFLSKEQFVQRFETPNSPDRFGNQPAPLPCRLCVLLWYSMSSQRRKALAVNVREPDASLAPSDTSLPKPEHQDAGLRVRIWEERPLSRYTYMQLHWGETAIGARLLVHRDELFPSPSSAAKNKTTGSSDHFDQANKWLTMCKESHKVCQGVGNKYHEPPGRMLFLHAGKSWQPGSHPESIKLVDTHDVDAATRKEYFALSHCWGPPAEMRFKLLASNIDACREGIDFGGLSRNMQDAITVTLRLGFSYLWIDSLCIIQKDDKGQETGDMAEVWKKDWEIEAKKMGGVYSGAVCTIASTGSASSAGGCFHQRDPVSLQPCKIGVSSPDALCPRWVYARRDDVFDFTRGVDLGPLNTRGWVMQERLLSRRILHFGDGMLYWECGGRSASELNPHGYTYKTFPEDFKDNYMPDLDLSTRGELRQAELEGQGLGWAADEELRRRPPPVMIDPDAPPGSQAVWQRKRGFWKNVLKPNEEPWADDETVSSARAGFRAAFEQLRAGAEAALDAATTPDKLVGRHSFSQLWYDVVEAYSRGKLTAPGDKLMALKGIEDEVARATRLTYVCGLWSEHLVTDLLWFAIEGPGRRLLMPSGVPVAPTWSWASIEGAVALDLLPQNALSDVRKSDTLAMATIHEADPSSGCLADVTIALSAPLLSVEAPKLDNGMWQLYIGKTGQAAARMFPDVATSPGIDQMSGLVCASFIVLHRDKVNVLVKSSSEDVQGLVLRRVGARAGAESCEGAVDIFERVGYFTTSYIEKSRAAQQGRKALKTAEKKTVHLAGWSGTVEAVQRGDDT